MYTGIILQNVGYNFKGTFLDFYIMYISINILSVYIYVYNLKIYMYVYHIFTTFTFPDSTGENMHPHVVSLLLLSNCFPLCSAINSYPIRFEWIGRPMKRGVSLRSTMDKRCRWQHVLLLSATLLWPTAKSQLLSNGEAVR